MLKTQDFLLVWTDNGIEKRRKVTCTANQATAKAERLFRSHGGLVDEVDVYKGHRKRLDRLVETHSDSSDSKGVGPVQDTAARLVGAAAGEALGCAATVAGTALFGPTLLAAGCATAIGVLVYTGLKGDRSR